jgi:orotate phosphoribosyltransferase
MVVPVGQTVDLSMRQKATDEQIALAIIGSGAVEIRDVDNGEKPFVYSSDNQGPGYVMVKGQVGQRQVMKFLTAQLALKVAPLYGKGFDFIEGNATGGMVPAWQLTDDVERVLGMPEGSIPYTYLRGSRKEGGHGELITGNRNNPHIKKGMRALVVEELVNFAETTTNAAQVYRDDGYPVTDAACILSYDHPSSNKRLAEAGVALTSLITLPRVLDMGEATGAIPSQAAKAYREFLADPVKFQLSRGWPVPEKTAKEAMARGYTMEQAAYDVALAAGAPKERLDKGVQFFVQVR